MALRIMVQQALMAAVAAVVRLIALVSLVMAVLGRLPLILVAAQLAQQVQMIMTVLLDRLQLAEMGVGLAVVAAPPVRVEILLVQGQQAQGMAVTVWWL
jgi:hypothetical protein